MTSSDPKGYLARHFALLALTFALLGSGSLLYYYLWQFMPRVLEAHAAMNLGEGYEFGHDFYPVWLTSRKCIHKNCDPYSPEMTRDIQRGLFGRALDPKISSDPPVEYRTFAYPAFTVLLFWPAAEVPFTTVRVIVAFVLIAVTIVSVVLWMKAESWHPRPALLIAIALLTVCSYPVLEGVYAGQLGLLVGFFLATSLLAVQRGRILLAGTLMALTTIKPQMTLLSAGYLLLWSLGNWRQTGTLLYRILLHVGGPQCCSDFGLAPLDPILDKRRLRISSLCQSSVVGRGDRWFPRIEFERACFSDINFALGVLEWDGLVEAALDGERLYRILVDLEFLAVRYRYHIAPQSRLSGSGYSFAGDLSAFTAMGAFLQ